MSSSTIYWYDFETFGADPRRDRACQFAGIRTDEDLNIIDEPLVIYCSAADDFLPNPFACLVTGITPQVANRNGIAEAEINNFGSFVHFSNVDINVSTGLYLLDFISLSLFLKGDMIFLPFRLITISDFSTKSLFNLKLSGSQN